MVKSIIVFVVFFCIANSIFSQSGKTEDVIYINNQWIIRGQILNRDSASVKILTHDGNTFVFTANEVDKIVEENTWGGFTYKKKGFANFTELGPLIAGKTTIEGVTTAAS